MLLSILFKKAWLFCGLFLMSTSITLSQTANTYKYDILTPAPGPQPRVNGAMVYGCRPGHPFIYRIPCQGNRPILFTVKGLPNSLKLDRQNGIITGISPGKGIYTVVIRAQNSAGTAKRTFKIICGDKIALKPPMGWNDWYAYFDRISDTYVRQATDVLVSSGMADAGYQYINIDDCWANKKKDDKYYDKTDAGRKGDERDANGNIFPNSYFPDMKKLTDYIHSLD